MFKKLIDIFKGDNDNTIPKGLGVTELPMKIYQGKQPIKSSDFKNIVNEIFLPKIQEVGFKGKDFYFYREYPTHIEAIFFWTYKTGGAIQVDLLVKFKNINYPDNSKSKTKEIRPDNSEFQKRLSPNNEKNKNGQNVWFWVFEDSIEKNRTIVEDIWRVFSERGLNYLKRFENSQDYIGQITTKNYSDFPDFFINKFFGRHESGIIFFLFEYWLQQDNEIKAKEFAELGFDLLKSNQEDLYFKEFKNYLDNGN
jgi:hypothetical protein